MTAADSKRVIFAKARSALFAAATEVPMTLSQLAQHSQVAKVIDEHKLAKPMLSRVLREMVEAGDLEHGPRDGQVHTYFSPGEPRNEAGASNPQRGRRKVVRIDVVKTTGRVRIEFGELVVEVGVL